MGVLHAPKHRRDSSSKISCVDRRLADTSVTGRDRWHPHTALLLCNTLNSTLLTWVKSSCSFWQCRDHSRTILMNRLITPVRETLVGGSETERWRCGGGDVAAEQKRVSNLAVRKPWSTTDLPLLQAGRHTQAERTQGNVLTLICSSHGDFTDRGQSDLTWQKQPNTWRLLLCLISKISRVNLYKWECYQNEN